MTTSILARESKLISMDVHVTRMSRVSTQSTAKSAAWSAFTQASRFVRAAGNV